MKQVKTITIRVISMSGFKSYKDKATFQFGDTTYISGSNGQGKSSIADAIAFAFMGVPFFGDKGLDRLQNKNTQEMTVSIDFTDDSGEEHNLTRTRKRDTTSISYDGYTVRQSDLNTAFGDKDIFLSILNPLYFINVLGDSGKILLEKLLPVVKHEEVLAALSEYSRKTLAGHHLSSPETFIKNHRAELKEAEDTLIGYRSRQDLLISQRKERAVKLGELQNSVGRIKNEMSDLIRIRDNNRDITTEESELANLRRLRAELLSDAAKNNGTDKAMQEITSEIRAIEKSIAQQAASQYISTYTNQIAEAEAKLRSMHNEHTRLSMALNDTVIGYKCPTCAVIITVDNIEAVKADLQNRLAALVNDGKTARSNLAQIKEQDEAAKRKFDGQKDATLASARSKLGELNQRLQELNVARQLDAEDSGEQILALESKITALEYRHSNGNWTQDQAQRFTELEKSKNECEAGINALNTVADNDYVALIAETEADITQIKRLINEVVNYAGKRTELMLDGLKMSSAEIVLTEVIKSTGEVKDCFRFSYDGRDYKCLSLSEKIRAGLEVSALIQRLSGRCYPVFVDNAESLCSLGNAQLHGQMIYSRVVRNQGLQVTHKNSGERNIAS